MLPGEESCTPVSAVPIGSPDVGNLGNFLSRCRFAHSAPESPLQNCPLTTPLFVSHSLAALTHHSSLCPLPRSSEGNGFGRELRTISPIHVNEAYRHIKKRYKGRKSTTTDSPPRCAFQTIEPGAPSLLHIEAIRHICPKAQHRAGRYGSQGRVRTEDAQGHEGLGWQAHGAAGADL